MMLLCRCHRLEKLHVCAATKSMHRDIPAERGFPLGWVSE